MARLLAEWTVLFDPLFEKEFEELNVEVQNELLAHAKRLETFGPQLGRPWVDTLRLARNANLKELRFWAANCEWRVAFGFDPKRRAVLLVAAPKQGKDVHYYATLTRQADERYDVHLRSLGTK